MRIGSLLTLLFNIIKLYSYITIFTSIDFSFAVLEYDESKEKFYSAYYFILNTTPSYLLPLNKRNFDSIKMKRRS